MIIATTIIGALYFALTPVMGAVAYNASVHREKQGGTPLVVMMIAAIGWAAAEGIKLLSGDPSVVWAAEILRTPLVDLTAAGWLYVAVEYTEQEWLKRRSVLAVIGAVVVIDLVGGLTNQFHHLYFLPSSRITEAGILQAEYGLLWYAHAIFDWIQLSGAFVLLVIQYRDVQSIYRKQTGALILGMSVGWAASFLNVALKGLALTPVDYLDPTPFGVAGTGVFLLFALFRWEFLQVAPVARKTLMETMDDAVVAVDANDRIIDINPAARKLLGIGSETLGEDVTTVLTDYQTLIPAVSGAPDADREVAIEVDGDERHLDLTISPLRKGGGRTIVIRDVTEKRRRQQELERQRKLQERNDRLEEFGTVVTHDLRNPLTIAQSHLSFAMEDIDDTVEGYEFLHDVDQALSRIDRLTEDLLTLARHGQRLTDTEPLDFNDALNRAWDDGETANAELVITSGGTIEADRQRLSHLLEHLFSNAPQHGPDDITVRAGLLENGFYVEDDGPGIPADQRNQVLEYGYTTESGGTGLGLSIVTSIAEAHGWTVTLSESDMGGARFEVTDVVTGESTV
jgi:PAS domain S-box-containing protein